MMSELESSKSPPVATSQTVLPRGFRLMLAREGERLDSASHVLVFDRALGRVLWYDVLSYNQHRGWHVGLRHNDDIVDSVWLDDDSIDFWGEDDLASGRARRGPESVDGTFVALMPIDLDDFSALYAASSLYHLEVAQALADARALTDGGAR